MLKSMLQSRLRAFLEGTMREFTAPLDSGRLERAKKLQYHYAGIERNLSGDAVIKWHIPSQSNPGTVYECYVSIKPKGMSLFAVANNVRDLRSRVTALKEADVRCFCPCKDFRYSGAAYNMSHLHDGFEEGHGDAGSDIPPDVRDPAREHTICKHLAAAFKGMLSNAGPIMKDARAARFPKPEQEKVDLGPLSAKKKKPVEQKGETPEMFPKQAESPKGERPEVIPEEGKTVISDKDALPKMEGLNPIRIPEAQESLDALAGVIEHGEEVPAEPSPDANPVPEENDENPEENGELPEMPGLNVKNNNDNLMYGLEDAVNDPIFNPDENE